MACKELQDIMSNRYRNISLNHNKHFHVNFHLNNLFDDFAPCVRITLIYFQGLAGFMKVRIN